MKQLAELIEPRLSQYRAKSLNVTATGGLTLILSGPARVRAGTLSITADPRANTVRVSGPADLVAKIKTELEKLDVP